MLITATSGASMVRRRGPIGGTALRRPQCTEPGIARERDAWAATRCRGRDAPRPENRPDGGPGVETRPAGAAAPDSAPPRGYGAPRDALETRRVPPRGRRKDGTRTGCRDRRRDTRCLEGASRDTRRPPDAVARSTRRGSRPARAV